MDILLFVLFGLFDYLVMGFAITNSNWIIIAIVIDFYFILY